MVAADSVGDVTSDALGRTGTELTTKKAKKSKKKTAKKKKAEKVIPVRDPLSQPCD